MKIQKTITQITLEKEEREILKKAYNIISEINENIPNDSIVHLAYHYDSIDIDQFEVLFEEIIKAEQIKIELT